MPKRFIHIVDDFYPKPDVVRQRALQMFYTEPENLVGWRTQAYQPRGIKGLIEKRFRIKIRYWEEDLEAIEGCNGVFFSAFSTGKRAEKVGVHFDDPPTWVMLLIYLTPGAPYDAGTSLWQHRKTCLISNPTSKAAARLGTTVEELEAQITRDSQIPNRWIEIDRIGNVYNRAVIFPGGMLHSATTHFGSNRKNGRLYQSFHFPIERLARSGDLRNLSRD